MTNKYSNITRSEHIDIDDREKLSMENSGKNEKKLRFIIDTATILNSSLDYNITLKALAELSTTLVCDWCVIDLLDDKNKINRVAVSHIIPEKIQLVKELSQKYGPGLNNKSGIWNILRTGKSELYKEVSTDLIRKWTINEEHFKLILELGLESGIVVPLKIREKVFGTITFIYADSKKRYDEEDLSFAEELATRTALAIDNSRLYKESIKLNLKLEEQVNELRFEIEERKKAKKELTESEEKFRQLAEHIKSVFYISDVSSGKIIYLSPAFEEVWGMDSKEVYDDISKLIEIIHPDDRFKVMEGLKKTIHSESVNEFRILKPDGQERWIYSKSFPINDESGNAYRIVGVSEDITLRKSIEEQIKTSLKEKDVLLREVHHRVKNNLQIISSLLSLQSGYIKNEEDLDIFLDSQNRVKAMALVHEKLYQKKDLSGINFNDYLKDLLNNLRAFYNHKADKIKINVNVDEILLNIDLAMGLGLIFNELISNTFKYAFPGNMEGELSIIIKSHNKSLNIAIFDNGIGLPEDLDFRNSNSLGLQLVNTLVEQHYGDIQLNSSNGTKFIIDFPEFS